MCSSLLFLFQTKFVHKCWIWFSLGIYIANITKLIQLGLTIIRSLRQETMQLFIKIWWSFYGMWLPLFIIKLTAKISWTRSKYSSLFSKNTLTVWCCYLIIRLLILYISFCSDNWSSRMIVIILKSVIIFKLWNKTEAVKYHYMQTDLVR